MGLGGLFGGGGVSKSLFLDRRISLFSIHSESVFMRVTCTGMCVFSGIKSSLYYKDFSAKVSVFLNSIMGCLFF